MDYRQAIEELSRLRLVPRIWKKIESGFYPEIDKEIKLMNIQNTINAGHYELGFWRLIKFIINDLLAMSYRDLPKEEKELTDILGALNDQRAVRQQLNEIKQELTKKLAEREKRQRTKTTIRTVQFQIIQLSKRAMEPLGDISMKGSARVVESLQEHLLLS